MKNQKNLILLTVAALFAGFGSTAPAHAFLAPLNAPDGGIADTELDHCDADMDALTQTGPCLEHVAMKRYHRYETLVAQLRQRVKQGKINRARRGEAQQFLTQEAQVLPSAQNFCKNADIPDADALSDSNAEGRCKIIQLDLRINEIGAFLNARN